MGWVQETDPYGGETLRHPDTERHPSQFGRVWNCRLSSQLSSRLSGRGYPLIYMGEKGMMELFFFVAERHDGIHFLSETGMMEFFFFFGERHD